MKEQAALIEGMLRGFHKHVWPRQRRDYPEIVAIEQEMIYEHDGLTFMAKPDLIVRDKEGDLWYCLDPQTKILTGDLRWVAANSIKEGDVVAGFDEEQQGRSLRRWHNATVGKVATITKPTYRVGLEDGTSVVSSGDHRWLTESRSSGLHWCETRFLQSGDHKLLRLANTWGDTNGWNQWDAGYLAAGWDGEGSLIQRAGKGRNTVLNFAQRDNIMMDTIRSIMDRYGLAYNGPYEVRNKKKPTATPTYEVRVSGRARIMEALGTVRPRRLLQKFSFDRLGSMHTINRPRVTSVTYLGERDVVAIETSTKTLVAEGFASHNCEYKTTSSSREQWVNSWATAVQLHSSVKAVEATLGEPVTGVIVQGLYKGFVSYGKQSSPFCYSYRKEGNPPFSKTEYLYDYKAGFRKYPTWEMEGGTKAWVEGMSEEMLAEQFPQVPPIFINDQLVETFFRQRAIREREIHEAQGERDDKVFPMKFEACCPSFGHGCSYRQLCFGGAGIDPLQAGYTWRQAHHQPEMDAFEGGAE